jgi:hypothetical protein
MQGNAALSENLISFAGGGNENLFVNKVQAYLSSLYGARYFLKGNPSLSYSRRSSSRQRRDGIPILVPSRRKEKKREENKKGGGRGNDTPPEIRYAKEAERV